MPRNVDGDSARLDDAARAGWLYYVAGNTQDEIAKKLGVSRQSAQRLVSLAISERLIKVRLDHPIARCMELASLLRQIGLPPAWYSSALGVHVVWTLPFGFLVMMAVFNRFDSRLEEAARDMGADEWTVFKEVTLPLITPGIVAAGLFGFTLSYDEFARTTLLAGAQNTLPLDINAAMTQRVQPTIFALGTASTIFSLLMIGLFIVIYTILYRRSR